jgi:hypothetical protein
VPSRLARLACHRGRSAVQVNLMWHPCRIIYWGVTGGNAPRVNIFLLSRSAATCTCVVSVRRRHAPPWQVSRASQPDVAPLPHHLLGCDRGVMPHA